MPGSVSKYCLQHSPVPVIVVRPLSKRDKKKRKRMQDPTRQGYRDILDKSEDVAEGGHILDQRHRRSMIGPDALADTAFHNPEEEARMVAEAIGYRSGVGGASDGSPLTRVVSGRSEISTRSGRSASMGSYGSLEGDSDPRSPKAALMKSPELRDLDSPAGSDYDDSDDEKEQEPVPAYVLAQEEALMKARERAIKTEEEERERELERLEKENKKPKGKKGKNDGEDHSGGFGALAALDALGGSSKKK